MREVSSMKRRLNMHAHNTAQLLGHADIAFTPSALLAVDCLPAAVLQDLEMYSIIYPLGVVQNTNTLYCCFRYQR